MKKGEMDGDGVRPKKYLQCGILSLFEIYFFGFTLVIYGEWTRKCVTMSKKGGEGVSRHVSFPSRPLSFLSVVTMGMGQENTENELRKLREI